MKNIAQKYFFFTFYLNKIYFKIYKKLFFTFFFSLIDTKKRCGIIEVIWFPETGIDNHVSLKKWP